MVTESMTRISSGCNLPTGPLVVVREVFSMRRDVLVLILVALLILIPQPAPVRAASCWYVLGFEALHDQIPRSLVIA